MRLQRVSVFAGFRECWPTVRLKTVDEYFEPQDRDYCIVALCSRCSKRSPNEQSEIRGIMPEWSDTGAILSHAENSFLRRHCRIGDRRRLVCQGSAIAETK
jgi:hypothetical protein